MKKYIINIIILLTAINCFAQEFEYGIRFDPFADNKETVREYSFPQTMFGARLAVDAGTVVDSIHRLRVGIDLLTEFGTSTEDIETSVILYYGVENKGWDFYIGAFPRRDKLNFPIAILNDTLQYYKPNIDGLYVNYSTASFNHNLFVDWTGRRGEVRKESFIAGASGRFNFGKFFVEDYLLMYHIAGTFDKVVVTDNGAFSFAGGYEYLRKDGISAGVKTGIIGSYYRYRGDGDDILLNSGWYSELYGNYKWFSTKFTYKQGEKLDMLLGDSHYNNAKSYLRTDLFARVINKENIKAQFGFSIHMADGEVGNQQTFKLAYVFRDI